MMCAVIEDLLPASYFSATLLGIQTDQRVLRHLIVQYLPRLDKLLQEHDIGRSQHQSSRGPDALAQGPGLLDTTSRGQGSWPPWLGGRSSCDSGRAVGPACNLHCPGPQCSLRLCLLSPLGVGKASCHFGRATLRLPPGSRPSGCAVPTVPGPSRRGSLCARRAVPHHAALVPHGLRQCGAHQATAAPMGPVLLRGLTGAVPGRAGHAAPQGATPPASQRRGALWARPSCPSASLGAAGVQPAVLRPEHWPH